MNKSSQSSQEKLKLYLAKFYKNGVWKNSNSATSTSCTNLNGNRFLGDQRDTYDQDHDNDMSMHLVPSLKTEVEEPAHTYIDSYFTYVNEELSNPKKSTDNENATCSTNLQQNSVLQDQIKAQKYEKLFRKVLQVQSKKTKIVRARARYSRQGQISQNTTNSKPFIDKKLVIVLERLPYLEDLVLFGDKEKKTVRKRRLRKIKVVGDGNENQKTKRMRKEKKDHQTDTDSANDNDPLLCHLCASSFVSTTALKNHIRYSHKDSDLAAEQLAVPAEKTICTICGKSFSVRYIKEHMATVHTKINEKVTCTFEGCGKVFITRKYMLSHLRYHQGYKARKKQIFKKKPKPSAGETHQVPCPQCKILVLNIYLRNHLGCFHGLDHSENLFDCPIDECTAKANSRKEINNHIKSDHEEYARTMGLFDKPFKCTYPQCDKSFAYNHTLNDHIKSHTDPNQTTCPVCGKNVKSPMYLKIHIKDVHGERNSICPVENCNHRFSLATNLKKHLRKFHQKDSILRKKDNVQAYIDKFVRLKKQNEINPDTCEVLGLGYLSTETINTSVNPDDVKIDEQEELDWIPNQKSSRGRKRRE